MPLDSTARELLLEATRTPPTLDTGVAPVPARLGDAPEDFQVTELPAYEPTGEGEHLYLRIEKRGLNTKDAVERLAQALGLDPRASGWAGLKDRHAVTRQWVSLHAPGEVRIAPDQAFGEGLWVREVSRHGNKLRSGHLLGNRFELRLEGVPAERDADVARVLEQLCTTGMPNYFGEQRFGRGGRNLVDALAWIVEGGRAPRSPFVRKLLMSTWQSAIFNQVVAARVAAGTLASACTGDLLRKEPAGGHFLCEDPSVDTPRVRSWEISPTGPMFGAKMRCAAGDVADRENQALSAFGGDTALLSQMKRFGEGTRRMLRVRPEQLGQARSGESLVLSFSLPAGSYATILLRQLTHDSLFDRVGERET